MSEKRLKTGRQLVAAGAVSAADADNIDRVAERYSVALTRSVVSMMDAAGAEGPVGKQFIPDLAELAPSDRDMLDPIGDANHSPVKGIVHRYPDRALLAPTHLCSVYCRYCFRREFVGDKSNAVLSDDELASCIDYLREHPEIWEVILTGGDPLTLSARRLRTILDALDAIPHVRITRIHSRVPTVAPERIDEDLLQLFKATTNTLYLIVHVNHPDELTDAALKACASLVEAGVPMLSQSVLLKGVNDSAETLGRLMRKLVENRIKPYYLHHCDFAPGTKHFRVPVAAGQQIMRELRGRYSGLCQPEYVLDIPGGAGKSPIGPGYLQVSPEDKDERRYRIEDFNGEMHDYPDS